MKTSTKTFLGVVLVLAVAGAYFFPRSEYVVNEYHTATGVGSAAGTTFGTAKVAQINITPSAANSTSTSILNTDSFDRVVDQTFFSCTGVGTSGAAFGLSGGLANLTITAATGSTPSLTTAISNPNLVMVNNVATTSAPLSYGASSTVVGLPSRYWLSGSYMNIQFNATNTAACTVGIYYHGS